MNITSCYSDKMGGFKNDKEFGLGDMIDINFNEGFKLSIIRLFQDIKIFNVERLDKI